MSKQKPVVVAGEAVDLRRGVDHIGVSVVAVVHDGKGNVLLQKRSRNTRDEHGRWDLTGGALEFGEQINEALARELGEELLTEPLDTEFLVVYDAHRVAPDGTTPTHWIAIIFAARVDPEKVSIGEPHKVDELGWFTSKTLPEPLHSQFWKSYQVALERGIVK